jgi:hypothetical protein
MEAIRQMLDTAITTLTGLDDADAAWTSLFGSHEQIGVKVNTINTSSHWTHARLAEAVADRLQEVGIPAEQIILFDRTSSELEAAYYKINRDGPGVRCHGTDSHYTAGWTLMDTEIKLSDILLSCDALVNIPLLKQHDLSGISFAMKNHYGCFDRPGAFHRGRIKQAIPELNALPPIQERTRLIVGDAMSIVRKGWYAAAKGNSILMSLDPVAHDTVGLQLYIDTMAAEGSRYTAEERLAKSWLQYGAQLGLGTNNPDYIDLIEIDLE